MSSRNLSLKAENRIVVTFASDYSGRSCRHTPIRRPPPTTKGSTLKCWLSIARDLSSSATLLTHPDSAPPTNNLLFSHYLNTFTSFQPKRTNRRHSHYQQLKAQWRLTRRTSTIYIVMEGTSPFLFPLLLVARRPENGRFCYTIQRVLTCDFAVA